MLVQHQSGFNGPATYDVRRNDAAFQPISLATRAMFRQTATCQKTALAAVVEAARASRTKAIENIEVGDLVWAWDEIAGRLVKRPVKRLFRHKAKPILTVTIADEDGSTHLIEATTEHPFWVEERGWVAASELLDGDVLRRIDVGNRIEVVSVNRTGKNADVYNFEVATTHNYFVSASGVLVHNMSHQDLGPDAAARVRERLSLYDERHDRLMGVSNSKLAALMADMRQQAQAVLHLVPDPLGFVRSGRLLVPATVSEADVGKVVVDGKEIVPQGGMKWGGPLRESPDLFALLNQSHMTPWIGLAEASAAFQLQQLGVTHVELPHAIVHGVNPDGIASLGYVTKNLGNEPSVNLLKIIMPLHGRHKGELGVPGVDSADKWANLVQMRSVVYGPSLLYEAINRDIEFLGERLPHLDGRFNGGMDDLTKVNEDLDLGALDVEFMAGKIRDVLRLVPAEIVEGDPSTLHLLNYTINLLSPTDALAQNRILLGAMRPIVEHNSPLAVQVPVAIGSARPVSAAGPDTRAIDAMWDVIDQEHTLARIDQDRDGPVDSAMMPAPLDPAHAIRSRLPIPSDVPRPTRRPVSNGQVVSLAASTRAANGVIPPTLRSPTSPPAMRASSEPMVRATLLDGPGWSDGSPSTLPAGAGHFQGGAPGNRLQTPGILARLWSGAADAATRLAVVREQWQRRNEPVEVTRMVEMPVGSVLTPVLGVPMVEPELPGAAVASGRRRSLPFAGLPGTSPGGGRVSLPIVGQPAIGDHLHPRRTGPFAEETSDRRLASEAALGIVLRSGEQMAWENRYFYSNPFLNIPRSPDHYNQLPVLVQRYTPLPVHVTRSMFEGLIP